MGIVAGIARWGIRIVNRSPQSYIRSRIQGRMAGSDQRGLWDPISW